MDRILRAHKNGEEFHVIIVIPAVPGFAGDLKSDGALGTRAIMEYQCRSRKEPWAYPWSRDRQVCIYRPGLER